MMSVVGRLQYDKLRGVIYFFNEKTGACLLRIEGAPQIPDDHQLDIHLVHPGNEHHHENCGNRALILKNAPQDPGAVCAVKMERERVVPNSTS